MSAITKIAWTDRTWNPVRGCSIVSSGCINCYAAKQAHRFSGKGQPYEGLTKLTKAGPQWTGEARPVPEMLTLPLKWRKPSRIFVNSMSDLFHEDVPDEFIDRVFAVMHLAERHTFQILTKRAERMRDYITSRATCDPGHVAIWTEDGPLDLDGISEGMKYRVPWPLPNVCLVVSVENQPTADERIPLLLQTPAAVRGVSYEPALDAVNLMSVPSRSQSVIRINALNGGWDVPRNVVGEYRQEPRLHWVVVGGESGPGARPFDIDWARDVVRQCQAAGVACFVKQLGSRPVRDGLDNREGDHDIVMRLADRKGADMSEWPEDLRVRQYPESR